MNVTARGRQVNFPWRSFRYVYLLLLVVTLVELVHTLSTSAPYGFMAYIAGAGNDSVATGILWVLFSSWAAFICSVYLGIEWFEGKEGRFASLRRPSRRVVEVAEWLLRFTLIVAVTVKFWKPASYQDALLAEGAICLGLLAWSILVWRGFGVDIGRWPLAMLLVIAIACFILAWFAYDENREGDWGLLIVIGVAWLIPLVFGLTVYLVVKLRQ